MNFRWEKWLVVIQKLMFSNNVFTIKDKEAQDLAANSHILDIGSPIPKIYCRDSIKVILRRVEIHLGQSDPPTY